MNIVQSLAGLGVLTEQVIASDLLLDDDDTICALSQALTEATTPAVRTALAQHLQTALTAQERITNYMLGKGYCNAVNPQEQLRLDMQAADQILTVQPGG